MHEIENQDFMFTSCLIMSLFDLSHTAPMSTKTSSNIPTARVGSGEFPPSTTASILSLFIAQNYDSAPTWASHDPQIPLMKDL